MRNVLVFFAVLAGLAGPARADFNAGLQAYQRGDYAGAIQEWRPIAEKGDANAQYNLGLMYARGQGLSRDYAEAAKWYRKAAEQGNTNAQYNLGVMYANGEGVPQDQSAALNWFKKAAEQGDTAAASSLGSLYEVDKGGFKDYAEAMKWYRRAADQGVASAQFNLAVMYDIGQGVPKDYAEAIGWYRKAAEQGYAGAMTNLGILYYNGQGVSRDVVQAYSWFDRGRKAGDSRADDLLKVAANKLSSKQLKQAETLAAQWRPPKAVTSAPEKIETASAQPSTSMPPPEPSGLASKQSVWTGVSRIVAVGDVHGDYEQFIATLQSAGLIDRQLRWIGGTAHLVQTGDVVDRGPDSRKVMDLLMYLEYEAPKSGGYVHCLIGNHEAMNVYGDLRYASPGEFAAFRTETSEQTQASAWNRYRTQLASTPATPDLDRSHWEAQHPAGFTEHRAQLGPAGKYGKWIISHNTAIRINDTLFVHAGISPKYAKWSLDQINDAVRGELADFEKLHGGLATDPDGPLWYRGLAQGDQKALGRVVDDVLRNFGVNRIVIGHSYADAAITPRLGGKVIMIDIGLSRVYDNLGKLGSLVIENGKAYALHRGTMLPLPASDGEMLAYLKKAASLDPAPSPLEKRIAALEAATAR